MTLAADIAKVAADSETFHDIVQGPAGSTVTTDAGAVPTLAEALSRAAGGLQRGAWVGSTTYAVNDVVTNSGSVYRCTTAHTSGTFATDLAAGKWYQHSTQITDAATALTTLVPSMTFGVRNKVVNANFDTWDKGTSFTNIGNGVIAANQWKCYDNGTGNLDITRQDADSNLIGARYYLRAARSAGTDMWGVFQFFDTSTLHQLRGKTATLSVKLRKGSSLTASVYLNINTTSAEFGVTPVENAQLEVTAAELSTTTWAKFNVSLAIPNNTAALGLDIRLYTDSQAGGANVYFEMAQVQLEEGASASIFESKPMADEALSSARVIAGDHTEIGSPFAPSTCKNLLINADMRIDNRNAGAAQTFTAAAALAYCVDRWYGYCTGANVTGQRVAGTAPNQYNYRFTGAAGVTKIGFAQRIEAANSQHLAVRVATLTADLANSVLTTVTWTAWYADTADTFGTLASPTRTQIATGTITVSATLTRYAVKIIVPAAAVTGIEVELSVGSQTSGTWTIGRVQLEDGSVATAFDARPIDMEERRCARYLPALNFLSGNQAFGPCFAYSTTELRAFISFATKARTAPTGISTSAASGFVGQMKSGNLTASGIAYTTVVSDIGALITLTVSGATAGDTGVLYNASSGYILFTGCEL